MVKVQGLHTQYMNKIKLVWKCSAIAITLYGVWIFNSDLKNIQQIETFNINLILFGVFFAFLNYILRALRWHWLLNKSGENIKISKSFLSFFSGFFYTFTPGKIGEIAKSLHLYDLTKIPARKSLPIIWIERTSDVAGVTMLCFPIFIYMVLKNKQYLYQNSIELILISWIFGVIAMLLLYIIAKSLVNKIASKSVPKKERKEFVKTFLETLKLLKKNIPQLLLWGWFAWVLEGITCFLCLEAIFPNFSIFQNSSTDVSLIEKITALTRFYSTSMLAGALSFIPGGLGATELTLTNLLMLSGFEEEVANSGTFLTRLTTLWVGFPIGIISVLKINNKKRESRRLSPPR